MSKRVYNFAAGPAVMPVPVLEQAAAELVCHGEDGMSVMEMSHRTKMFEDIIFGAEADLRKLMNIPDNYKVLFLQGGGTLQFSMVPINLYRKSFSGDIINTDSWTKKVAAEAAKVGKARIIASSEDKNFSYIPIADPKDMDAGADMLYICYNNTIVGTRYTKETLPTPPESVPLVADISSNVLSEVLDVNKFGLVFFGSQKNSGPAGLTVVVVRDDLIGFAPKNTPVYLDYATHAKNESMYNTPPAYSVYMAGLVYKWVLNLGGVPEMQKINEYKAALLYDFIDNSAMYKGTVINKRDRSLMNATFLLPSKELTEKFAKEAEANGLYNLKGHRSVGGMRASIYNAMPVEGVNALIEFMKKFELENK